MLQFIIVLSSSLLAGFLYRLGGNGSGTLYRDLGVPLLMIVLLSAMNHFHWSLILSTGLLFASLTTYNKWVGRLFGRRTNNVYWESWLITGLFYGLSILPYVIFYTQDYVCFTIRCICLSILTCLWSIIIGKDWLEEGGRGFFIIATLPILFY